MKLGKAIRLCRTQRCMSMEVLAELANISVSYLSLLERDKRDPAFSVVWRIAHALHVPLAVLVFLADNGRELADISPEAAEKLSRVALGLLQE